MKNSAFLFFLSLSLFMVNGYCQIFKNINNIPVYTDITLTSVDKLVYIPNTHFLDVKPPHTIAESKKDNKRIDIEVVENELTFVKKFLNGNQFYTALFLFFVLATAFSSIYDFLGKEILSLQLKSYSPLYLLVQSIKI